uniref:Ras-associating domain-containing protein n=1 Tax=Brugia timori TaxID=42155 RepID=A0A0R3QC50_9BILA
LDEMSVELLAIVGADESPKFKEQSRHIVENYVSKRYPMTISDCYKIIPGEDHFTLITSLSDKNSTATKELLPRMIHGLKLSYQSGELISFHTSQSGDLINSQVTTRIILNLITFSIFNIMLSQCCKKSSVKIDHISLPTMKDNRNRTDKTQSSIENVLVEQKEEDSFAKKRPIKRLAKRSIEVRVILDNVY